MCRREVSSDSSAERDADDMRCTDAEPVLLSSATLLAASRYVVDTSGRIGLLLGPWLRLPSIDGDVMTYTHALPLRRRSGQPEPFLTHHASREVVGDVPSIVSDGPLVGARESVPAHVKRDEVVPVRKQGVFSLRVAGGCQCLTHLPLGPFPL